MNATGTVRAGEPFKPSASAWNSLVAMKRRMSDAPLSAGAPGTWNKCLTVFVKNGATPLDAGSPVGIGDSVITPDDATAAEWRVKQVYDYAAPEDGKPWGVILAPAPAGALIPLCLSGTAPARITMSDATHGYARINTSGELVSGFFGDARILWAEPEPVGGSHIAGEPWDAWCLIAVGDSVKPDGLPYGYIRLYRGALTGTWRAGEWLYPGLAVFDDTLEETPYELLGYEGSVTKTMPTGIDVAFAVVILEDLPDPYSSAVPEWMPNKDRKDYCIASIGGAVKISIDDALIVPSSETAGGAFPGFVGTSPQELSDMASETEPSTLQTFQTNNVWQYLGAGYYAKINKQLVHGAGAGLVFDGTRFKLNAALPGSVGANPFAFCCTSIVDGVPSFGFVEITPGTGGGGMEEFIAGPSLEFVDGEPQTLQLVADANDAVGFYHADVNESAPTREWVKNDGSLVVEDATVGKTLHLQGDKEAPTSGTDKLLYVYDRSPTEEGDKKRKWAKIGANGGLKVSSTVGSIGVRLDGTTDTAPSTGAVWGRVSSTEYGWFTPIVIVIS